jgi:phospholipase/carboxylesterase
MPTGRFDAPVVVTTGADDSTAALVVLLHGRGSDESSMLALAPRLPAGPTYAALRAPIREGGGYAWFANRGIGRPIAESLADTMAWFRTWLDTQAPAGRPVVLIGFSGGAAFAGGLILSDPERYAAAAVLLGTLPFAAGVPVDPDRLDGVPIFVSHGEHDTVIPRELLERTWTYLHDESGAEITSLRSPEGHTLSAETVRALGRWVSQVTTGPVVETAERP